MLPAEKRLRHSADFAATTRGGQRTGRPSLVLYVHPTGQPARVGFTVSKAVGNAVTRNRVKRRLRHLVAAQLLDHDAQTDLRADLVIRALPKAATEPDRLAADFASVWRWAVGVAPGANPAAAGAMPEARQAARVAFWAQRPARRRLLPGVVAS